METELPRDDFEAFGVREEMFFVARLSRKAPAMAFDCR